MTKDIKEEIKEFDKLIKKYPYKKDLYIGRAMLYTKIKQYKKAAEDYTKVHTNYISYDILNICERDFLINEAEEIYTKAINKDKNDFANYTRRAYFYMRIGELKKALTDCETALKISPKNEIILMIKGTLVKKLNTIK